MPKIIENLREILIEEAKKQVKENGYSKVTIRSVAGACKVGVGTVYNYFPSKDMLVATFMLEDWNLCIKNIRLCCEENKGPEKTLQVVYEEIIAYIERNKAVFQDREAHKSYAAVFNDKHKLLRGQIAGLIAPMCQQNAREKSEFLPEFVAEAFLTWTVSGKDFEEIYSVLKNVFKEV